MIKHIDESFYCCDWINQKLLAKKKIFLKINKNEWILALKKADTNCLVQCFIEYVKLIKFNL